MPAATLAALNRRRIVSAAIGTAATAAVVWLYLSRGHPPHREPADAVPIQDGRTLDFSSGSPVLKDDAANKAKMDAALRDIDAADKTVTFRPDPTPAK